MRTLILTASFLFICIAADAQRDDREMKERYEAMKIAFISERLELTPAEAQTFWPLYNAYEDQLKTLKEKYKRPEKKVTDLSESESLELINNRFKRDEEKLAIMKNFATQLDGVLSNNKIARLIFIEEEFKSKMLKKVKNRMGEHSGEERPRDGRMRPGN